MKKRLLSLLIIGVSIVSSVHTMEHESSSTDNISITIKYVPNENVIMSTHLNQETNTTTQVFLDLNTHSFEGTTFVQAYYGPKIPETTSQNIKKILIAERTRRFYIPLDSDIFEELKNKIKEYEAKHQLSHS